MSEPTARELLVDLRDEDDENKSWHAGIYLASRVEKVLALHTEDWAMTACMACRKPLRFRCEVDADGVKLVLCGGCAGEVLAYM